MSKFKILHKYVCIIKTRFTWFVQMYLRLEQKELISIFPSAQYNKADKFSPLFSLLNESIMLLCNWNIS